MKVLSQDFAQLGLVKELLAPLKRGEPTVIDFKGSHFERDIILWGVRW